MLRGLAKLLAGALVWAFLVSVVQAQTTAAEQPLSDPALERRALALYREIRCLVCQNQSIAESNAGLARDLRQLVRERLGAGDSDAQVIGYLVERYGDWVLLKPPFKAATWALWLAPVGVLLLAGLAVFAWYRRSGGIRPVAALNEAERRRLREILDDGNDA